MNWSDVLGSTCKSSIKLSTTPKDLLKTADIAGAQVGTTPRSAKKKQFSIRRPVTSLDVSDINGKPCSLALNFQFAVSDLKLIRSAGRRFRSQKNTNPLAPEYVMRVESDLGYMGRAASAFADEVKKTMTHNIITNQQQEQFPKRPETVAGYRKTDLDEKDSAVKNLAPLYDRISTGTGTWKRNTALMSKFAATGPAFTSLFLSFLIWFLRRNWPSRPLKARLEAKVGKQTGGGRQSPHS